MSSSEPFHEAALVEQRLAQLAELCALGDALLTAEMPPLTRATFEQRALGIEGRVSASALGRLPRSFGRGTSDARDVVLWASFAGASHALAWMPDVVVDPSSGGVLDHTPMILVAVTQQFDRPVDAVDRGYKTIVTVRVLGARSSAFDALPVLDTWDNRARVLVGMERDRARTSF